MNISKVLGLLIGTYLIQGLLGKYSRRILIHQRKIVSHSKCKEDPRILWGNLCSCEKKARKISGILRYWCKRCNQFSEQVNWQLVIKFILCTRITKSFYMLNACIVESCDPLDSTDFDLCDFESQLYALNSVKTIIFLFHHWGGGGKLQIEKI